VRKYSFSNIKQYIGIDTSIKSLFVCKERLETIHMSNLLIHDTLWSELGFGIDYYDVISSQFAFHYAFKNETTAKTSILNVKNALKYDGLFIGTIPTSDTDYKEKQVTIPGYDDVFVEPTVTMKHFESLMNTNGFETILLEYFDTYFAKISQTNNKLLKKMKADKCPPKNNYAVFVFGLSALTTNPNANQAAKK
jgi:hypothetical protein